MRSSRGDGVNWPLLERFEEQARRREEDRAAWVSPWDILRSGTIQSEPRPRCYVPLPDNEFG